MTLEEIQERIDEITAMRGDCEMAHGREDDLYVAFIEHVANSGDEQLAAMARLVLTAEKIDFTRWYA